MFPFLDLPAEIRALVIEHALFDSRDPPRYPTLENRVQLSDIRHLAWRARPHYENFKTHSPSNCLALLLIYPQISTETRTMMNLQKKTNYHLDISVLDDNEVFPTWLSVPFLTTRINKLFVDVRLFGNIISPHVSWRLRGDGGHAQYEWDFLALLERFLRYGPVGEKKRPDGIRWSPSVRDEERFISDRGIKVDTVILDFSSAEEGGKLAPREVTYVDWRRIFIPGRSGFKDGIMLEEYNTRPEWLAELLADEINCCLHFGRDREMFGKLMFERLRMIRMFVDGKSFQDIDVAGRLDDLKYHAQEEYVPEWVQDI
ncbi:hypothetical protein BDW69DRAFT_203099 [Aspergillus filifer]